MATGDVQAATEGDVPGAQVVHFVLLPPRMAAAEALAAYLRKQRFWVWEGSPAVDELSRQREVTLAQVLPEFPGPKTEMLYPSASISDLRGVTYPGGFTPTVMEETHDVATGTVLWCLGQAEGIFQVDFWADSIALRDALGAQIHRFFNPRESMHGVLLQMPETYACAICRYTLTGAEEIDTPESAYANERRVRCSVRWEAPLLDRRSVALISPRTLVTYE